MCERFCLEHTNRNDTNPNIRTTKERFLGVEVVFDFLEFFEKMKRSTKIFVSIKFPFKYLNSTDFLARLAGWIAKVGES